MEKQGKTTVAIVTTAFTKLARAQASALGSNDLPIAEIPHPFGSRTRDEIRSLAEQTVDRIVKLASE